MSRQNKNMSMTLTKKPEPEIVGPHESTIMVRTNPANLSEDTLQTLRMVAEPRGQVGDEFRQWLRESVLMETGRRMANDDAAAKAPLETAALLLPWHRWTDDELRCALAASYSWTGMVVGDEAAAVFDAIHEAVLTAACTRLYEFHTAIEQTRRRRGEG